jgi:hypothetical protein
VTITDIEGGGHAVEVKASSLFQAVALALKDLISPQLSIPFEQRPSSTLLSIVTASPLLLSCR